MLASTPTLRARLAERLGLNPTDRGAPAAAPASAPVPPASIDELQARAARAGGGIYLASDEQGRRITAPPHKEFDAPVANLLVDLGL